MKMKKLYIKSYKRIKVAAYKIYKD